MSQYNPGGILMSLDDYYEKCVTPKPHIPKKYSHGPRGELRKEALDLALDEYKQQKFNELRQAAGQPPLESVQWRIEASNVNRPAGMAPLVPRNVERTSSTVSYQRELPTNWRSDPRLNQQQRQLQRDDSKNGNRNSGQFSVQDRLGPNAQRSIAQLARQGLRTAVNMFTDNDNSYRFKRQRLLNDIRNQCNARNKYGIENGNAARINSNMNPFTSDGCSANGDLFHNEMSNLPSDSLEAEPNNMPALSPESGQQLTLENLIEANGTYENIDIEQAVKNAVSLLNAVANRPDININLPQTMFQNQDTNIQREYQYEPYGGK